MEQAKKAYESYKSELPNAPEWDALPENVKQAWVAAVQAVPQNKQ